MVPYRLWGCREHAALVPPHLRDAVTNARNLDQRESAEDAIEYYLEAEGII